jgi:hypothetical protein
VVASAPVVFMSAPQTGVARVCALLNAEEARYIVVGATAMQLWGTSRSTRDIDILIEPSIGNAERVLRALCSLPFGVAKDIKPADLISRPVTMIGDTPNVDVLTRAWNLQWSEAEQGLAVFDIEGVPVPTVSIANLITSKRTGRPQDVADIQVLEELRRMRQQE